MKLGLIAFANDGGLGAQCRRLAYMLNPDRVMAIDSTPISPNKALHYDWYKDYKLFICGWPPSNAEIDSFLQNLTHVLVVENPYNFYLVWAAQKKGIKVFVQSNYEFCDNLDKPYLPVPDKFLMPSYWKIGHMEGLFGKERVEYLPPPINPEEFASVRRKNFKRKGKPRFLHVVGTVASNDRNGTLDLLEAVSASKSDFELVIKTQHELQMNYFLDDKRVHYVLGNAKTNTELYEDFDALILPRRYGGLSLTTNEALMSGLPVIMTNISPNNGLLPPEWLVDAEVKGKMRGRSVFEVFGVYIPALSKKIDWLCKQPLEQLKEDAFQIGHVNFSEEALKPRYKQLFT